MESAKTPGTSTTLYFVLAITITNVVLVPPVLAALGVIEGPPESLMAGAPIAIFGPTIAAISARSTRCS